MSEHDNNHTAPDHWPGCLAAWLAERKLDKQLREAEDEESLAGGDTFDCDNHVNAFDTEVGLGDLRLLSRGVAGDTELPVYVAVISRSGENSWLIAPYSRYAQPATPGELLTGREDAGLRVVAPAMAHPISTDNLSKSWLVDKLLDDEVVDALAVFQHVAFGEGLSDDLVARVGPPIFADDDPRQEYRSEFRQMLEPIRSLWKPLPLLPPTSLLEDIWQTFKMLVKTPPEISTEPGLELLTPAPLTAAGGPKANEMIFNVRGENLRLRLLAFPADNKVSFSLFGENDELTDVMDDCKIMLKGEDGDGHVLSGGEVTVSTAADVDEIEFQIHRPDGELIDLDADER